MDVKVPKPSVNGERNGDLGIDSVSTLVKSGGNDGATGDRDSVILLRIAALGFRFLITFETEFSIVSINKLLSLILAAKKKCFYVNKNHFEKILKISALIYKEFIRYFIGKLKSILFRYTGAHEKTQWNKCIICVICA